MNVYEEVIAIVVALLITDVIKWVFVNFVEEHLANALGWIARRTRPPGPPLTTHSGSAPP